MRRVFSACVRGVVAGSIVMAMAMPLQAQPSDGGGTWIGRGKDRIVKFMKRWTVRTFGDGLVDPRP